MDPTTPLDSCSDLVSGTDRAATVRATVETLGDAADLAAVFGMLADPGRLRLLVALLAGIELCVCDLADVAQMSESATSHALRLLRAHRIVRVRRAGRMAHYRLEDEHVRRLLELALAHQQHATVTPSATTDPPVEIRVTAR